MTKSLNTQNQNTFQVGNFHTFFDDGVGCTIFKVSNNKYKHYITRLNATKNTIETLSFIASDSRSRHDAPIDFFEMDDEGLFVIEQQEFYQHSIQVKAHTRVQNVINNYHTYDIHKAA